MRLAEDDGRWERAAAEARAAFEAWCATHPRATLRQLEVEVDRHLAPARARLLEAAAAGAGGADEASPPPCPACGEPMRRDGERSRRLTTTHEQTITLSRRYARCPACDTGVFPPG